MSKKILVADDSVVIQKAIGITFAQEDFEVTFVGNGEEALQRAKEIHPDLILADTSMPKMSGSDLCRKLRSDTSFMSTPIILLASNKETFSPSQLESFGANDYVQKPFESTQLLTKTKTLLTETPASALVIDKQKHDILSDSSILNEVPPAINRSGSKPKPKIEEGLEIATNTAQQAFFQEKTSGEADLLPPQADSFPSVPTPSFESSPDFGSLLDNSDSAPQEPIIQESVIPEPDFKTSVRMKPAPVSDRPAAAAPTSAPNLQLSEKQIEEIVARVFQNVIERIAWEVVPDLAERIIKDEIEKLTQE